MAASSAAIGVASLLSNLGIFPWLARGVEVVGWRRAFSHPAALGPLAILAFNAILILSSWLWLRSRWWVALVATTGAVAILMVARMLSYAWSIHPASAGL